MSTIIKVENLSKKYVIGHQKRESYTALRDVMMHKLRGIGERIRHPLSPNKEEIELEEFWALKDINLEIKQGDRVGIIGRNGAGKSTLLKVLSRITEPTKGRITINGRVASLLEVGTGFHPELTGRENIYLNGAILGMSKAEINKKFDEIVIFAEVEKFLDTPVKRYSSGMYVRLAFAVAAHLEPEILIVDEVLAVGDYAFQKKCIGKMEGVAGTGRTVIFVSHQLDMIRALCNRCALLDGGELISVDDPDNIISSYTSSLSSKYMAASFEISRDEGVALQILKGSIKDENGKVRDRFDVFEEISFEFVYVVHKPLEGLMVNFELKRNGTTIFFSFDTDLDVERLKARKQGIYLARVKLPCPLLKPGQYSITPGTGIANSNKIQHLEDALRFEVEIISRSSSVVSYSGNRRGIIAAPLEWRTEGL